MNEAGDKQERDEEGGHMSSTAGRVVRRGGDLPFVAILSHHDAEATEHCFATMREAEAFIKRNTPVPQRTLSALYDPPRAERQVPAISGWVERTSVQRISPEPANDGDRRCAARHMADTGRSA